MKYVSIEYYTNVNKQSWHVRPLAEGEQQERVHDSKAEALLYVVRNAAHDANIWVGRGDGRKVNLRDLEAIILPDTE